MAEAAAVSLDDVLAQIEAMIAAGNSNLMADAVERADDLLAFGDAILERWILAHGEMPTTGVSEGFRLLALHRQGARGDPSFNACRETCRELVYHHNLVRLDPTHAEVPRRLRLGAMIARHLALFIGGKLEVTGLGEFCCSSRPLRERDSSGASIQTIG